MPLMPKSQRQLNRPTSLFELAQYLFANKAEILNRAAALLRDSKRRYAELLTLEMGKVIGEAEAEVELSAQILEYYAEHAGDCWHRRNCLWPIPPKGKRCWSMNLLGSCWPLNPGTSPITR
jgi:acyl-CoA reductase-like NAD-dependent aldehyde dehydrogenase